MLFRKLHVHVEEGFQASRAALRAQRQLETTPPRAGDTNNNGNNNAGACLSLAYMYSTYVCLSVGERTSSGGGPASRTRSRGPRRSSGQPDRGLVAGESLARLHAAAYGGGACGGGAGNNSGTSRTRVVYVSLTRKFLRIVFR